MNCTLNFSALRSSLRAVAPAPLAVLLVGVFFPLGAWADAGILRFEKTDYSVDEGKGSLVLKVRRREGAEGAITVSYSTDDGEAVAGSDYANKSGTLVWADGDDEDQEIVIAILDDALEEANETFAVVLSSPTGGATLDESVAEVVIEDDDQSGGGGGGGEGSGEIGFKDNEQGVDEDAGIVVVELRRIEGDAGAVTVSYATEDGAAIAGADYVAKAGTVTWSNGDSSAKFVTIGLLDDSTVEPNEVFAVRLSNPSGASFFLAGDLLEITVEDDDESSGGGEDHFGVIKFDEENEDFAEGAGTVMIAVERSEGSDGSVSVSYATEDRTATAGADYAPKSGVLTWQDGDESNKYIAVTLIDDSSKEPSEFFAIRLAGPTGGAVLHATRFLTEVVIGDDDAGGGGGGDPGDPPKPGVFKFDQRTFKINETIANAVITVERSMGEDGAVSVRYATILGGTADEGLDYTPVEGLLEWGNGDGSLRSFLVPILPDDLTEPTETVSLVLESPTGGASLDSERSHAVLSIVDGPAAPGPGDEEDAGVIKFDESENQVLEAAGFARLVVERSKGEAGAVTVDYQTVAASAEENLDYEPVFGTLFWGTGDGGKRVIEVPILDDDLQEGTENLLLVLSNVTGGATIDAARSETSLNVLDDDAPSSGCSSSAEALCLVDDQFEISVVWRTPDGNSGRAQAVALTGQSGLFWFFSPDNLEMLVKVIDACQIPAFSSYWVFYAATTNVDFTLTVIDRHSGLTKEYNNLQGQAAKPVQDTFTFATCPVAP